jgi:inosine-uridine nucleoside N-ribohydrolase
MGSKSGDVDDGFAIAAYALLDIPIAAIVSTYGNTSAAESFKNTRRIFEIIDKNTLILKGCSHANDRLPKEIESLIESTEESICWIALGPLTTISRVLSLSKLAGKVKEVYCVGGNEVSKGFLPPVWPMEFNFFKDQIALETLLKSDVSIKMFPLNQCRTLWVKMKELETLGNGNLAVHIREHSKRWVSRNMKLLRNGFPIWDLVTLAPFINNDTKFITRHVSYKGRSLINFKKGTRPIKVLASFDSEKLWQEFKKLIKDFDQKSIPSGEKRVHEIHHISHT